MFDHTPHIETASPLRKWYLRVFQKYRVSCAVRTPILVAMGTVIYRTTWVLVQS